MKTQQEIEKLVYGWYMEDEMPDEDFEYAEAHLKELDEWTKTSGKTIKYSTVFIDENTGRYYEAWNKRVNAGYWGETDLLDCGCHEVEPKQVTKTIYIKKENNDN